MNLFLSKIKQKINFTNVNWIVFAIYLLLAIISIRGVIFTGETIGLRHDWAVPQDSAGIINWVKEALYPWSEERGGLSISYWSDIVLRFTVGLFGFLGLGGSFLSSFYIIFSITLAGLGSYVLFEKITKTSHQSSFIGSIIYVFNPLVFNKIISGHTYYLIAYALAPWFFYFFIKTFNRKRNSTEFWFDIIISSLLFALCGAQTQFVILLFIFMVVLVYVKKLNLKKFIFNLFIIGIITLLLHLSWLTVFFLSSIYYQNPVSLTPSTFSWFVYNSSHIFQSFFLVGGATDYLTHSLEEYYLFTPWLATASFILLFILYNLSKSNKQSSYFRYFIFFLLCVLVLSISRIIPELSFTIFKKSILFNIFREVYHATFLAALSLSILVVYSFHNLSQQKNKFLKILIGFSIIIFVSPFFVDGKLINNLQTFRINDGYLEEIESNSRILYLPGLQPLLLEGLEHSGVDPNIYFSSPSSLSQISSYGSLTDRFNTFFQSQLYFNSKQITPVIDQYLQLFNVEQIIYRPNFQSDLVKYTLLSEYPNKIEEYKNSTLVKILSNYSNQIVSETSDWIQYQFGDTSKIINSQTCLSSGSWTNLNQIFKLTGQAECNGVFFAKDSFYQDIETSNVLFTNNNYLDYLVANKNNIIIEPGLWADQTMNPKEDWVSAPHVWWYNSQFAGYSKLLAFTSKKDVELSINTSTIPAESYYLFVETFQHPDGDNVKITYQDWQQTINNHAITSNFVWNKLDTITIQPDENILTITNLGGENAIGQIMLIPTDQYQNQIEEFNSYLKDKNEIILINPQQVGEPISSLFDLSGQAKFYANFPEYSDYEFSQNSNQIDVKAKFTGPANQDEYATIIYSTKQYNLQQTPIISIYSSVENEEIQFWEMGLEIDSNNDGTTDSYAWGRLKNGQNLININEFIATANAKLNQDNIGIIAIRFQPHKEYSVDMKNLAKQEYNFSLSDVYLYTSPENIIRPARQSSLIDINRLINDPPHTIKFTGLTNLYNDFDNTSHQITVKDNSIEIDSNFSNQDESSEYATVIINTDIDLNFYPYFTADLGITNQDIQFYDLSFGIDTTGDDEVDYHIWVDSIMFDKSTKNQTIFYDLKNLLQLESDNYQNPRLIQIEILPHRQYQLKSDIAPVKFSITNFNFYHEAALQSVQTDALPASHYQIDIPESGEYYLYININSEHSGQLFGSLTKNNFDIKIEANSEQKWYKISQFDLEEGENNLALITYDQSFTINNIALFNMKELGQNQINQPTDIKQINPTHYQANIDLKQSGYIVLKESYHPAWYLTITDLETGNVTNTSIRPTLINGWQQAYYIETPGNYQLEFQYSLTTIYRICLLISLISVASLVVVLMALFYIKNNNYSHE